MTLLAVRGDPVEGGVGEGEPLYPWLEFKPWLAPLKVSRDNEANTTNKAELVIQIKTAKTANLKDFCKTYDQSI